MPIDRETDRKRIIWKDQVTVQRDRQHAPAVTYIVVWKRLNPRKTSIEEWRESKPTNRINKAQEQYESRCEYAVLVELQKYDDDGMRTIRRFCNLNLYRQYSDKIDWILNTKDPPYEIKDDRKPMKLNVNMTYALKEIVKAACFEAQSPEFKVLNDAAHGALLIRRETSIIQYATLLGLETRGLIRVWEGSDYDISEHFHWIRPTAEGIQVYKGLP